MANIKKVTLLYLLYYFYIKLSFKMSVLHFKTRQTGLNVPY